jgi:hypothetical protein
MPNHIKISRSFTIHDLNSYLPDPDVELILDGTIPPYTRFSHQLCDLTEQHLPLL